MHRRQDGCRDRCPACKVTTVASRALHAGSLSRRTWPPCVLYQGLGGHPASAECSSDPALCTRRGGALKDTPPSAVQLKKDNPDFARLRVTDKRAVIVKSVPVDFNRIKVPLTCSVNAAAGFNWQGAPLLDLQSSIAITNATTDGLTCLSHRKCSAALWVLNHGDDVLRWYI